MNMAVQSIGKRRHAARRSFAAAEPWNTRAYLADYYSRLEPTERRTMPFLQRVLARLPRGARALDFGSGPTLHHAIQLAGGVHEVHVADVRADNLRAILRWRARAADAHDWSPFTRYALQLAGVPDTDAEVSAHESLARRRLTRLLQGDARRLHPLGADARASYDLVTSFFCADSMTSSLDDWRQCTRNIAGLVAPGGWLVLGALRCCSAWRHGNSWLPSPCIDAIHLQYALDCAGFGQDERRIEIVEVPDQRPNGFDSMLLVAARALPASCSVAGTQICRFFPTVRSITSPDV